MDENILILHVREKKVFVICLKLRSGCYVLISLAQKIIAKYLINSASFEFFIFFHKYEDIHLYAKKIRKTWMTLHIFIYFILLQVLQ